MDANLINRSAAKDIKAPQNQATQHQLPLCMRNPKPLCWTLDLKFDQVLDFRNLPKTRLKVYLHQTAH